MTSSLYNKEVIGLIPAAGKGLRLGLPYPKELYPVISDNRYKPVAQFIVDDMVHSGVEHIIFVINETKHQLIGFFGSGSRFGCRISYVFQDNGEINNSSTSPGLAHALDAAFHLTKDKVICFGMPDTIMTPKPVFRSLLGLAAAEGDVFLGCFKVSHPEKFGMVEVENSIVRQIIDKPRQTDLSHAWGCIVWGPKFTEHLHRSVEQKGLSDFAVILNDGLEESLMVKAIIFEDGSYSDLGTYDEIAKLDHVQRA